MDDEKATSSESAPLSTSPSLKTPTFFGRSIKLLSDLLSENEPTSPEPALLVPPEIETDTPLSSQPPERWMVYLIGLVVGIALIISLPAPYSVILLIGLIIVALLLTGRDAGLTWREGIAALPRLARKGYELFQQSPAFVAAHRQRLTTIFALSACGLMILSAIAFRPMKESDSLNQATLLMLFGGVALGIAISLTSKKITLRLPTDISLMPTHSNGLLTLCGVLLLVLLAETNAKAFNIPMLAQVSYHVQFLLLAAGIVLITLGLSNISHLPSWRTLPSTINWLNVVPILGIFVLALVLRFWQLPTSLRGSVDEVVAIDGIFHALGDDPPGLVSPPSAYMSTPLFSYWQAQIVSIFGHSLTTLRATSAITGALTVIALYLLASALFDRKTALIAAFLLATFPPHIHFSRISLLHIADPLFGTLSLAFLARGLKFNRRLDYALAGVSLGLTQYFFEAGRLLFPPLVILWIVWMALTSRRYLQTHWRGLMVMTLATLFVAAPIYYSIFSLALPRAARLNDSGIGVAYLQQLVEQQKYEELAQRILFPFQVYVHQPDMDVYYGGQEAIILPYLVPLLLLGVFYLFWRFRYPAVVVLLWIIMTALGNSLLRDSAVYARYVVVLPALVLIMAVAIRYVLPILWTAKSRTALIVLVGSLVLAIGGIQVSYYFNWHLPQVETQLRNAKPYRDGIDAMLRAVKLPVNTRIILISDPENDVNVSKSFLGFLLDNPADMTLLTITTEQFTREYISVLPGDKNYAFFVAPDDNNTPALLKERFQLDPPQESPYAIPMDKAYTLYYAPQTANSGS